MPRTIECFYPGRSFPSVSVSGSSCALDCKHCAGKYLEGMIPVSSEDELVDLGAALAERGAEGFLLSGGVGPTGSVGLGRFASAVRTIKQTTSLRINAHVGLALREELERLVRSGVDAFSVDIYGSSETIREVMGLDVGVQRYLQVARDLMDLGAPVVAPHICVGIHGGRLVGEHRAIELVAEMNPRALVFISLIPTRGTAYGLVNPPEPSETIALISRARKTMPSTRLLLGCMRSKKDRTWEVEAVQAGLDGIVLPADSTVSALRGGGFSIRVRRSCCAIL